MQSELWTKDWDGAIVYAFPVLRIEGEWAYSNMERRFPLAECRNTAAEARAMVLPERKGKRNV